MDRETTAQHAPVMATSGYQAQRLALVMGIWGFWEAEPSP